MHDIVHDFAEYLTRNEFISLGSDSLEVPGIVSCLEKALRDHLFFGPLL